MSGAQFAIDSLQLAALPAFRGRKQAERKSQQVIEHRDQHKHCEIHQTLIGTGCLGNYPSHELRMNDDDYSGGGRLADYPQATGARTQEQACFYSNYELQFLRDQKSKYGLDGEEQDCEPAGVIEFAVAGGQPKKNGNSDRDQNADQFVCGIGEKLRQHDIECDKRLRLTGAGERVVQGKQHGQQTEKHCHRAQNFNRFGHTSG